MTIIVSGDNQLAKECLGSELTLAFGLPVRCVERLGEVHDWSGVAVVLVEHGSAALHDLDALGAGVPAAPLLAIYAAPVQADEAMGWLGRGCAGYLPRNMGVRAIVCAVQLILRGERFVPAIALDPTTEPAGPIPSGWRAARAKTAEWALSPRQREVLRMVATGASNKHIARVLRVEEVTVKSHVKAIFRKLGVRSRTEAARYALRPETEALVVPGRATQPVWLPC